MTDLKKMVVRVFASMESGDSGAFDDLIADDYVNHDMPAPAPGRAGFKQMMVGWRAAFPDMKLTIEDVVGEGDLVATRGVFTGPHKGEFNGIPATGKRVPVPWMDMWRAKNGKLSENWVRLDMMAMLTQLGVIPAPKPR